VRAQVELRMRAEEYARDHPELRQLLLDFVCALLEAKPQDTVQFAAQYFAGDHCASSLPPPGDTLPKQPPPPGI
jgi:hypothetical protein